MSAIVGFVPSLLIGYFTDRTALVRPSNAKDYFISYATMSGVAAFVTFAAIAVLEYFNFYSVQISSARLIALLIFHILLVSNDLVNVVASNDLKLTSNLNILKVYILLMALFFAVFFWFRFESEWQYMALSSGTLFVLLAYRVNSIKWG